MVKCAGCLTSTCEFCCGATDKQIKSYLCIGCKGSKLFFEDLRKEVLDFTHDTDQALEYTSDALEQDEVQKDTLQTILFHFGQKFDLMSRFSRFRIAKAMTPILLKEVEAETQYSLEPSLFTLQMVRLHAQPAETHCFLIMEVTRQAVKAPMDCQAVLD
jgi:hypothetical protein